MLLPTVVPFEAPTPSFRSGDGRTLARVRRALGGFRAVDFDYESAEEAAEISGELLDRKQPLGSPDVLVAGIARRHDAELVTADHGFDRVPGLSVVDPRAER